LNDKNTIYNKFSKADSKIWIMVATESMETEVDLSDVKRVVQYSFLLDWLISVFIQQFGHTARIAGIKGEAIFLVESWAVDDRITSTRSAMLLSSQTLSAFRQPSDTSMLAWSYSAEAEVDSDVPDNESDVAVDDIDSDMPEEQHRHKTEKEHWTDLYNDSSVLYNLVNWSICLHWILID
jgi:superfamily II DNA/RNA helicase